MKRFALIALTLSLSLIHFASAEDNNDKKAQGQKQRGHGKGGVGNSTPVHVKSVPQYNRGGSNGAGNAQIQAHKNGQAYNPGSGQTKIYANNPNSPGTIANGDVVAGSVQGSKAWKKGNWNGNGEGNGTWNGNGDGDGQHWRNNGDGNGNQDWKNRTVKNTQWNHHRNWDRTHRDRSWWRSHYSRFARFGGGYYYWNSGFWYPAYGYDPYFSTYQYDAPVYGYNDLDPGQVIANVQAQLQQNGYYRGELDGQFGPMTRRALLDYQGDNGLDVTGEIDESTLESLGLQ
jgi:Putative peptidoglycan binding domain